ncbi:MAG TPA: hypothetical protein VKY59_14185 [Spirillospora sp.]|nr:hypothetical protein [Spirillospora sp.]
MQLHKHITESADIDSGYNPNRTPDLFALTYDGYIIAQDIVCQQEYVAMHRCPVSGEPLRVIAQINRAFQGLNEVVALSPATGERYSFIFDISNDVYQMWWADRMGDLYEPLHECEPRQPDPTRRFFT